MNVLWNKEDETTRPDSETLSAYVNSPLWDRLNDKLQGGYACAPQYNYSRCSMQRGWNVRYKKAGRSLCTLYPMQGHFLALVVIGQRESAGAELALPLLSQYLQTLYRETQCGMGQKWLMVCVTTEEILNDVLQLVAIRAQA